MRRLLILGATIAVVGATDARAQTVPRRQIPPTVLSELLLIEHRFQQALADDCPSNLCYAKGCAYVDHAVIDRPRATSMPGLGGETAPGGIEPQEFLTQAACAFAFEPTLPVEDAEALGRRLQSKVSKGFVSVSVNRQPLPPLPEGLLDPSELPPEPDDEPALPPPPPDEPWGFWSAVRELWSTMLPHLGWMIALVMITFAAPILFWSWRRVGKESIEERALLAQMLRDDAQPLDEPAPVAPAEEPTDHAFVAAEREAWEQRLVAVAAGGDDAELIALIRALLRDRDLPNLAKAVLLFPRSFVAAFPSGGDVAAAKLELADYVKAVDPAQLPSDERFFRALHQLARAASLAAQGDAELVRSLREEFGGAGLVSLIAQLPARPAALLFVLSPTEEQLEVVRLLAAPAIEQLAEQLLRSNRMDDAETAYLFDVLRAARRGERPPRPPAAESTERGTVFDAAAPLSVLLAALPADRRAALVEGASQRFQGQLPSWYRGILFGEMLLVLTAQARADVFLEIDADSLAAWVASQPEAVRVKLLTGLPRALRASIDGAPAMARPRQLQAADAARSAIARGLQRQLAQAGVPFDRALSAETAA